MLWNTNAGGGKSHLSDSLSFCSFKTMGNILCSDSMKTDPRRELFYGFTAPSLRQCKLGAFYKQKYYASVNYFSGNGV